jgi:hypothetical protein
VVLGPARLCGLWGQQFNRRSRGRSADTAKARTGLEQAERLVSEGIKAAGVATKEPEGCPAAIGGRWRLGEPG